MSVRSAVFDAVNSYLMHLDDEGELVIDVDEVAEGSPEATAAAAAVRVCPVAALSLE